MTVPSDGVRSSRIVSDTSPSSRRPLVVVWSTKRTQHTPTAARAAALEAERESIRRVEVVVVEEGDKCATCLAEPGVARRRGTTVLVATDQPDTGIDGLGQRDRLGTGVVDNHALPVLDGLRHDRRERLGKEIGAAVAGHEDADEWRPAPDLARSARRHPRQASNIRMAQSW